jgi:hypothetical protein
MVVPPVDWDIKPGVRLKRGEVPSFSELKGGYSSQAHQKFLFRFQLLSSKEYKNQILCCFQGVSICNQ